MFKVNAVRNTLGLPDMAAIAAASKSKTVTEVPSYSHPFFLTGFIVCASNLYQVVIPASTFSHKPVPPPRVFNAPAHTTHTTHTAHTTPAADAAPKAKSLRGGVKGVTKRHVTTARPAAFKSAALSLSPALRRLG